MTICIAANCKVGQAVVVGSDRMLSAPFLFLEFDHPDAKIDTITPTCVALTAGDALIAQDILAGAEDIASTLSNPTVNIIADHILSTLMPGQFVHLLCEGNSLRATARLADVAGFTFQAHH